MMEYQKNPTKHLEYLSSLRSTSRRTKSVVVVLDYFGDSKCFAGKGRLHILYVLQYIHDPLCCHYKSVSWTSLGGTSHDLTYSSFLPKRS